MILTKATQNAQQSADKCSSLALLHLSFYNKTTSSDFIISFRQHFQADSILSGVLFSVLKSVFNSAICTNSFETLYKSIIYKFWKLKALKSF